MAKEYPDELLADFQETYHLNLWEMGLDGDTDVTPAEVKRAAALAYQLPADSRVKRAIAPEASHSLSVQLMREIEYNQRLWHWANTEEAKNKDTAPNRMPLPGEEEAHEKAIERAQKTAIGAAELLGLKL